MDFDTNNSVIVLSSLEPCCTTRLYYAFVLIACLGRSAGTAVNIWDASKTEADDTVLAAITSGFVVKPEPCSHQEVEFNEVSLTGLEKRLAKLFTKRRKTCGPYLSRTTPSEAQRAGQIS